MYSITREYTFTKQKQQNKTKTTKSVPQAISQHTIT